MAQAAVLIPVHNAERFLRECLDSVIGQTFADFEVIACDDGSTDGSLVVLREYAARDPRIRVLVNPENRGIVATRNRLLSELPDDAGFVAWLDSDDVMLPDRLARQLDFLNAHPEIGGVGSALEIIDENSRTIGFRHYPFSSNEIRKTMFRRNVIAQSSLMLRRDVIRKIGEYSAAYPVCEDYDYWLRVLQKYDFANLPDPVLKYRMSPDQSKQSRLKCTLRCTLAVQKKYLFGRNFKIFNLVYFLSECLLLLLPSAVVLSLFEKLHYRIGSVNA